MDEEMISKKELLERYGISYGALYRWKRMGLIPESWFIRRSAPTGQETVFRRSQICERIELIQSKKEQQSLEALAASLEEVRHLWLVEDGKRGDFLEFLKEVTL